MLRQFRLASIAAAASVALASSAAAQITFDLTLAQAASDFTWSGTVDVSGTNYNVVGNPSNAFELAGHQEMDVLFSGSSIASASFNGVGDMLVTPDLHGRIGPAILPLYTIDCVDVHMLATSASFTVAANGSFTTPIVLTLTQGTMFIDPLIGVPAQVPMDGFTSAPDVHTGTLTRVGGNLHLVLPITTSFSFDFPPNTGTIDITGTLVADWVCAPAASYCTAKTNSLGCVPAITTTGAASYSNPAPFTVGAVNVLNNKSGLLYYGLAPLAAPFQGGIKCVASPTIRTVLQNSGGSPSGDDCSGTFAFDFNALIQSHVDPQLVQGREVYCQYWSRDPAAFASTNLTDGAHFSVCL